MSANVWNEADVDGHSNSTFFCTHVELSNCAHPINRVWVFLIFAHRSLTQRSSQMVPFPPTYTPKHTPASMFCVFCVHEPKRWAARARSLQGPCTGQDKYLCETSLFASQLNSCQQNCFVFFTHSFIFIYFNRIKSKVYSTSIDKQRLYSLLESCSGFLWSSNGENLVSFFY